MKILMIRHSCNKIVHVYNYLKNFRNMSVKSVEKYINSTKNKHIIKTNNVFNNLLFILIKLYMLNRYNNIIDNN